MSDPRYRAFIEDLDQLADATLIWIKDQLYEPADRGLERAILAVLWRRHSVEITEWPRDVMSDRSEPPEWTKWLGFDHLTYYCAKGTGHKDPAHRPVRTMRWPGPSLQNKPTVHTSLIECSCEARTEVWKLPREQSYETPAVWPVVRRDGDDYFAVCSQAPTAYDVKHAPSGRFSKQFADDSRHPPQNELEPRCICGWTLNHATLEKRGLRLQYFPTH
jgi:hypothetical protein